MKKITLTAILALSSFFASAADFVSVDVEHVKDRDSNQTSLAQYIRANKDIDGLTYGLQNRTSRYNDGAGMLSSLETTVGKNLGLVTPYICIGYDNAKNGSPGKQYGYGVVGANLAAPVGPGYAITGLKTRVLYESTVKQTVAFATYSIPVTKSVAVNLNASKSYQTIKENALGVGLAFNF